MPAGRPPKPVRLKLLQGKPGKRPVTDREPKPEPGIPTCPVHLTTEAKREWRRLAKQLLDLGVITQLDRGAFAAYCQAWGDWIVLRAEMGKPDFKAILTTDKGYSYPNPLWALEKAAHARLLKAATHLGLSPATRSRVKTVEKKQADPLGEFLSGRKKPRGRK